MRYRFDSREGIHLKNLWSFVVMLICRDYLNQTQRSKLRPFWSPWRVEKIFGDQNSGESRVMVTILQLKVAKRRLFEKVSLEHWNRYRIIYSICLENGVKMTPKRRLLTLIFACLCFNNNLRAERSGRVPVTFNSLKQGKGIMCILCTPRLIYQSTYRPTLDWCIGRHIGRVSTDVLVDISVECRSICWPRCVGRCIDRCINRDIGQVMVNISTDYWQISRSI